MSIVSGIVPSSGGSSTSDATAEQWHIKNGKTAYIASGKVTGNAYTPAMMQFDGSTGYYQKSFSSSGNKFTVCVRFNRASFSGGGTELVAWCHGSSTIRRIGVRLFSNDHALTEARNKITVRVRNTSNVDICYLLSTTECVDGNDHMLFFSFDGDAGTSVFRIDGDNADDTGFSFRVAATTGTLDTGAGVLAVGSGNAGATPTGAKLGMFGYRDAYLTNWSGFMQTDGSPKPLDESTWTEWGSQPAFWHEAAKMDENKGSSGAMTKNGTITLASAQ